jgi:hypothetical protein
LPIRRGNARVLFNEGAFAEDTMRSGRAGADALRQARSEIADRRLNGRRTSAE